MCGIVSALVFDGSIFRITESYVTRMRDTMAHRGPDGSGLWIGDDARVAFGHRRLSIIDLSEAASQPMCNEDGTLWVTFNGEIYNHAEVRAELERIGGHRWKTGHSDTEVILHAFEQWGIECLRQFRGMFAFGLWDTNKKELWLVRDRIGVKPLYYGIHHGRLTFASEIKALLEDPEQHRAVNEEAFFHYLSFLTAPAPQTLFDGIKKVPPGTWLKISAAGRIEERHYWDVWDHVTPLTKQSDEEIAERLLHELRTAVKYRKVSDVPVGVFLSGGIDSSTNAALFSEGEARPVKTFSIGYEGNHRSYPNELHYARKMAGLVGAEYHERLLTVDDLISFLPMMVWLQDEPIADPVCVPVYYVSKLARDNGVIVCQVGEGADELFCGYPGWKRALAVQQWGSIPGVPWFLQFLGVPALNALGKENRTTAQWIARASRYQPVFWGGAEVFSDSEKLRLLSPTLRKRFAHYSSWEAIRPIRQRFEERAWERADLNWMTYLDLSMRLPELLLMRVDKMSMAVGLEARVPFLDHKFVELAMSIPARVKTRGGVLKHILKTAVRGLIPDELIDRKKQGFGVPVNDWIMGRLGSEIDQSFKRGAADLFDQSALDMLMERNVGIRCWNVYNLLEWRQVYSVA